MIFQGAGAASSLGTPCGRQFASDSSAEWAPVARSLKTFSAQGWKGTSFRSAARSRMYLRPGSQTPERFGLPSAVLGTGAERFGWPSAVRGMPGAFWLSHWAGAAPAARIRMMLFPAKVIWVLARG